MISKKLPNYFAESLSKVRRFHDPSSSGTLSRSSSHDSLDSLNISDKSNIKEFGQVTNTVKAIEQEGTLKGKSKTLQLPSLITPVSLFGKRIR
jgi:lysophospholipase